MSLFVYRLSVISLYFLVYVDDLLAMVNDPKAIQQLITSLSATFALKDLDLVNYIDLEITR